MSRFKRPPVGGEVRRGELQLGRRPRQLTTVQNYEACRQKPLSSLTENSLAVLNLDHKILEANSQVQNMKLDGHQTCLSINRLWHELCDMLRRLVGTTAPGHHDCSIQE
ncbi:uncharacterized protein TNCV_2548491 [Trichonephila clavipes]|nr:uncharacterized protein TNCV_2548491 [Trichonephila clavipes]